MQIVGLCGYMGSGKSTAAKYLVEKHGFVRRGFAQPIKDSARALGLTDEEIDGALKEKPCPLLGGKTPRFFMQRLGTEFGRQMVDNDLWVNSWLRWIKELPDGTPGAVVDDVRFVNERMAIKHIKGALYKIERPGSVPQGDGHISEAVELLICDAVVLNNTTAAALGKRLAQVIGLE